MKCPRKGSGYLRTGGLLAMSAPSTLIPRAVAHAANTAAASMNPISTLEEECLRVRSQIVFQKVL